MPKLKQLFCTVELAPKNIAMKEYDTKYGDGFVKSYICVPPDAVNFTIHLTSSGYIAPGLAMFVFIDGVLQCNRNTLDLVIPDASTKPEDTTIDFRVRQKEDKLSDGRWIGREWSFAPLSTDANANIGADDDSIHNIGTIEVVVLRCYNRDGDQKTPATRGNSQYSPDHMKIQSSKAEDSKKGQRVKIDTRSGLDDGSSGVLGGLFDGASDEDSFAILNVSGKLCPILGYDGTREPYDWRRNLSPKYDMPLRSPILRYCDPSHVPLSRNMDEKGEPLFSWNNTKDGFTRNYISGKDEYKRELYPAPHDNVFYENKNRRPKSYHHRNDGHETRSYAYVPPLHLPSPRLEPSTPLSQHLRFASNELGPGPYGADSRMLGHDLMQRADDPGLIWRPVEYTREKVAQPASRPTLEQQLNAFTNIKGQRDAPFGHTYVKSPQATAAGIEKYGRVAAKTTSGAGGGDKKEVKGFSRWVWNTNNNDTHNNEKKNDGWGSWNKNDNQNSEKKNDGWGNWNNGDNSNHAKDNTGWGRNYAGSQHTGARSKNDNGNGWAQDIGSQNKDKYDDVWGQNATFQDDHQEAPPAGHNNNSGWGDVHKGVKEASVFENSKLEETKRADKHHHDFDPAVLPVKSYWTSKRQEKDKTGEARRPIFIVREEPLRRVPESFALEQNMSHQVQSGQGAFYMSAVGRPKYLDSMKEPYAVFIFNYRSKEMLEKILDGPIKESKESIRKRLDGMSKDELIERYLKVKQRSAPDFSEGDSLMSRPVLPNRSFDTAKGHGEKELGRLHLNSKVSTSGRHGKTTMWKDERKPSGGTGGWNTADAGRKSNDGWVGNTGGEAW